MSASRSATLITPLFCFLAAVLHAQPAPAGTGTAPAAVAVSTAAVEQPAPAPAARPRRYADDIIRAREYLDALLDMNAGTDLQALEDAVKDMNGLSGKVKELLPAEAVAELKARDNDRRLAAGREALASGREALQRFFADSEGKFPASAEDLSPRYMDSMPELRLPGHERTGAVLVIGSTKYDKDLSRAVGDTGGWLYFTDPKSAYWGMLMLDCSHKDASGTELYRY